MSVLTSSASWPGILDRLRDKVSQQQFSTWFQNLKAHSPSREELDIRVPNRFFKEWLKQNYSGVIEEAVREATGSTPQITFTVDQTIKPQRDYSVVQRDVLEEPADGLPEPTFRLNEQYTFDSFVVGTSNRLAHAAAVAVCDSPGRTYNPLFVYGSVGLGKSHLLQAVCHRVLEKNNSHRVAYLSCERFVNEFISAIQRNELIPFRGRYRRLDVLLIDDIQFLSRAERSQEEFFHTFNDLYNARNQVILSSDQPPRELTGLQERLTSRFNSGLVARIDPPSYEMRVAILRKKAEVRLAVVPDDVIEYVAEVITSNIRELDGAITKIIGHASLLGREVSVDVARTALEEPPSDRPPVTIENILRLVTNHFGVRVSDLQSRKRTRSVVLPRQVCMHLARALTPLSLEEIGGYFGGRDHSTVIYADEKIRSKVQGDATFGHMIKKLQGHLMCPPHPPKSGDRW